MSDHTVERRLDKDGCPYLFIKSPCGHEHTATLGQDVTVDAFVAAYGNPPACPICVRHEFVHLLSTLDREGPDGPVSGADLFFGAIYTARTRISGNGQ